MLLKLQFFWELTEGGSPLSFSRAFSSIWQGLSALPHTRIGQILASLANSCLGASICPMRVWLTSCRFALALSQTFNVCWEYGQICACVSPYFPTFPDISRHFLPPKRKFFRYVQLTGSVYLYCIVHLQHLLAPARGLRGVQHGPELYLREHHAEEYHHRGPQIQLRTGNGPR